jgi:ParB family chromosome partitioning protein
MAQTATKAAIQKIALSASRDIPFNKLLLSACNVRRTKAGVSIGELADDIARRTLLQSLTVRPVLNADGSETGMYEIPAGGRRYRALELLIKQKRLAKTAPIPCVIREGGIPEEDSLAENVQRAPLHPLDQFRAFLALRERGQSEEEIAAAFFVAVTVVKQRLRLASVSPKLLDAYAEDDMTLDQLMAFTVSGDWERQEQAWERLASSHTKEPYVIRRLLTEGAVRASDKRARFVGIAAYEDEGGPVLRDLFQGDDGGRLQDVAVLDRLVAERLEREAEVVRAEGWHWIEVAPDFAYGHHFGLRQLRGDEVSLTDQQEAERDALQAEYDQLEEAHADMDLPEAVEQRLAEIEDALAAFDDLPVVFDPADVARAGAFVSIDGDGRLRVERGYVRPEDELPVAAEPVTDREGVDSTDADQDQAEPTAAQPVRIGGDSNAVHGAVQSVEPEEDEGIKPLPDRLLTELTAHRTLALRVALGEHREVAFLAALHVFCLRVFYSYGLNSCLELDVKSAAFTAQAPGLNDTVLARTLAQRHQDWLAKLPRQPEDLWAVLAGMGELYREALFAHCVGLSVNGVHESYNRRPKALAHADLLAQAVSLDMVAAGWVPTVDSYLGRVTKARIVQAVREAKGDQAAQAIEPLKKGDMAVKAQELLAGAGWLPEPLRTPAQVFAASAATPDADTAPIVDREPPTQVELSEADARAADAPAEEWTAAAE